MMACLWILCVVDPENPTSKLIFVLPSSSQFHTKLWACIILSSARDSCSNREGSYGAHELFYILFSQVLQQQDASSLVAYSTGMFIHGSACPLFKTKLLRMDCLESLREKTTCLSGPASSSLASALLVSASVFTLPSSGSVCLWDD